jgi:hypothetical protein
MDCRRASKPAGQGRAVLLVRIESSCTAEKVDVAVLQGGTLLAPAKNYKDALFGDKPDDLETPSFARPALGSWLTVSVNITCDRAHRHATATNDCRFEE